MMSAALLGVELLDDLRLQALIELGNRFGGSFFIERTDDGLAFVR